jgi:hypothetical protein
MYTLSLFVQIYREFSLLLLQPDRDRLSSFCGAVANKTWRNDRFLDDLAYWGDAYDVASPKNPLVLVENTCIEYSKDDPLTKRGSQEALVPKGDGPACFGGLVKCSVTEGEGNSTCTLDSSSSSDTESTSDVKKRATKLPCYNLPALFYNCDLLTTTDVVNRNENTKLAHPVQSFNGLFPPCVYATHLCLQIDRYL